MVLMSFRINNWPIIRNDNRPHISTYMPTKIFKFPKKKRSTFFSVPLGYPNFLGGSNLGGNLGDNNEK